MAASWPTRSRFGNRGEHRLGIARAEHLDLAARHHLLEQFHVGGIVLEQVVEQPAGEVRAEAEFRETVQRFEKRPVAAQVRLVEHRGKIAHRLVGMHAEQQRTVCVISGLGAMDARPAHRAAALRLPAVAHRLGEICRRLDLQALVQIGEIETEQAVETRHALRRIVVAEPPEPVGTLADRELRGRARSSCPFRRPLPTTRS